MSDSSAAAIGNRVTRAIENRNGVLYLAILDLMAEAWEQGEEAGRNNESAYEWPYAKYKSNPYRSQA